MRNRSPKIPNKKSRKDLSSGALHGIPPDLRKALKTTSAARKVWEDITPLARNEWVCWVISVKKADTRKRHVERLCAEVAEGKRRPCCWAGCPHRSKQKKNRP